MVAVIEVDLACRSGCIRRPSPPPPGAGRTARCLRIGAPGVVDQMDLDALRRASAARAGANSVGALRVELVALHVDAKACRADDLGDGRVGLRSVAEWQSSGINTTNGICAKRVPSTARRVIAWALVSWASGAATAWRSMCGGAAQAASRAGRAASTAIRSCMFM